MLLLPNKLLTARESRLLLALQAIKQDATLSEQAVATAYRISRSTLYTRRTRTPFQRNCTPNLIKLLPTEETIIIQHILNLNVQEFPL
jgi:hypothetical protein